MKRLRNSFYSVLYTMTVGVLGVSYAAPLEAKMQVVSPCTSEERWQADTASELVWTTELNQFLMGKSSVIRSFGNALALKRAMGSSTGAVTGVAKGAATGAEGEETGLRVLSEYWIARTLQEAGLLHLAHQAMSLVAQYSPAELGASGVQIQASTVACLVELRQKVPGMGLTSLSITQLGKIHRKWEDSQPRNESLRPVFWKAASLLVVDTVSEGKEGGMAELLAILQGSGPYESFVKFMSAAQKGQNEAMVQAYAALLPQLSTLSGVAKGSGGAEGFFKPYLDHLKLLNARALYATHQWAPASEIYQKIGSRSNEQVDALSELSWAYLLGERYR